MREKTMKKGHLLLTLLAFVSLMWLGTIHANAATVKAKVDVKLAIRVYRVNLLYKFDMVRHRILSGICAEIRYT